MYWCGLKWLSSNTEERGEQLYHIIDLSDTQTSHLYTFLTIASLIGSFGADKDFNIKISAVLIYIRQQLL